MWHSPSMRLGALLVTILGVFFGSLVQASESRRDMLPETEQASWDAVGRLNVMGHGYCSATLIAPDLVLTAAHCITSRRTGKMVRAEAVHFLAGFRKGEYAAHGRAAELLPAPGYLETGRPVSRDLALVRLRTPIPSDVATPIPIADIAGQGMQVSSYSYGRDRSFIMSHQATCRIKRRQGSLMHTSCEATHGVSGAPLIVQGDAGPHVAGVIVAMVNVPKRARRGDALAVAVEDDLLAHPAQIVQAAPRPTPRAVSDAPGLYPDIERAGAP